MNQFPHLFEPIRIGKQTVKNRIFMPPLSTNLADKGYVTDALIEHYSNRAKGGVGLIVTEVTTVEPTYTYLPGDMSIYDDSYIPGWKNWWMPCINTIQRFCHSCFIRHIWHFRCRVRRS